MVVRSEPQVEHDCRRKPEQHSCQRIQQDLSSEDLSRRNRRSKHVVHIARTNRQPAAIEPALNQPNKIQCEDEAASYLREPSRQADPVREGEVCRATKQGEDNREGLSDTESNNRRFCESALNPVSDQDSNSSEWTGNSHRRAGSSPFSSVSRKNTSSSLASLAVFAICRRLSISPTATIFPWSMIAILPACV